MRRLCIQSLSMILTAASVAGAQGGTRDTVVRNADRPIHPGVATLVEELSIGVADGAEEYVLGEIADVALGKDGSIFVFDRQVPIVRHYDASGKFIRSIGRGGSGPGEYRSASGIATMPDGRLLVWDTGNWRINVYSANGDVLTQWTTPSGMSGGGTAQFSRAIFVDTAGTITTRKTVFEMRNPDNRPTIWVRFRPDGTPADTIHEPPAPQLGKLTARADRVSTSAPVPFAPIRYVAISPLGYLVAGYPNRYAFEIHQPGRAVVSVRRDVKPEPVSRSERAEGRKGIEERMRQTDPNWTWNGPGIPENKPAYYGLIVGLDGRIWISLSPETGPKIGGISGTSGVGPGMARPPRREADREPSKPTLYDVFEPDGRYLGQVQVPAGASAVVRKLDQVWAVAFGDDDVPRLKRYRIAWKN
jgi:hypothetical protein